MLYSYSLCARMCLLSPSEVSRTEPLETGTYSYVLFLFFFFFEIRPLSEMPVYARGAKRSIGSKGARRGSILIRRRAITICATTNSNESRTRRRVLTRADTRARAASVTEKAAVAWPCLSDLGMGIPVLRDRPCRVRACLLGRYFWRLSGHAPKSCQK